MSLYISLSDFKANNTPGALSFNRGCYLAVIEKFDEHWCLACHEDEAGFVPNNYIKPVDGRDYLVDEYVERAISRLRSLGNLKEGDNKSKFLKKLESFSAKSPKVTRSVSVKRPAPQPPSTLKSLETDDEQLKSTTQTDSIRYSLDKTSPNDLGYDLVEKVRQATSISHNLSTIAVKTVLKEIQDAYPSISNSLKIVLKSLNNEDIEGKESIDCEKLRKYLDEIADHRKDAQQRGWACHEDEGTILNILDSMLNILENANTNIIKKVLLVDQCKPLHNLVLYFQMESRKTIRNVLLRIFGTLCSFDSNFIEELLHSVLPLELCVQTKNLGDTEMRKYLFLVLSMLFCTGEKPAVHIYDTINKEFFEELFQEIERDEDEQMCNLLIKFIICFNLHFELPKENLIMKIISNSGYAKIFTEKLMVLFNRGDDPAIMFKYQEQQQNSIIKLLSDIFSDSKTANIFYTNDLVVFFDIVEREITNLDDGDKIRTEFLSLCDLALKFADLDDISDHVNKIKYCLYNLKESSTCPEYDKLIIHEILSSISCRT